MLDFRIVWSSVVGVGVGVGVGGGDSGGQGEGEQGRVCVGGGDEVGVVRKKMGGGRGSRHYKMWDEIT